MYKKKNLPITKNNKKRVQLFDNSDEETIASEHTHFNETIPKDDNVDNGRMLKKTKKLQKINEDEVPIVEMIRIINSPASKKIKEKQGK
jgi:hypothetical protein